MNKTPARLVSVAVKADEFRGIRKKIMDEAVRKAMAAVMQHEHELEQEILLALEEGYSITDVARAYTPAGNTPNRNKIYQVLKKYGGQTALRPSTQESPFHWTPRRINTVDGPKVVYDLVATLVDFGPAEINGVFTWAYIAGELEPVLEPNTEPYPNTKPYQFALQQWLERNPYPEEETNAST